MRIFWNEVKLILSGAKHMDESRKLSGVSYSSGIIHLIFTAVFAKYSMSLLAIYNMIIMVLYFYMGVRLAKATDYRPAYFFTMIEVIFHSALASLLIGWDCGFMVYTIAMVSVAFYFMLTIQEFHRNLLHPLTASFGIMVIFILTRHLCRIIPPYYGNLVTPGLSYGLYYLNAVIAFAICFTFSLFFTIEVFYTQNQLIRENDTLDQMASRDPLTKLLNRRSMETHLNQVMDHAKKTGAQFTVIMGDIDNFKHVNDTYGHDYGDKVLVMISETIRSQMRSEDQLCRWGGEEFLMLIHTNGQYAIKTAERVRTAISEAKIPIDGTDDQLSVTMTFGVSSYIPGYSMERLIQIADKNLYTGKKNGKNQVVS